MRIDRSPDRLEEPPETFEGDRARSVAGYGAAVAYGAAQGAEGAEGQGERGRGEGEERERRGRGEMQTERRARRCARMEAALSAVALCLACGTDVTD
jgi:hypothetical protein